ncbi:DoxX family protein [uncultured Litoreibacter sp.]|uniref:DoxX family protein n=1 Tax=uncultured Litoreibacter sp. TaxID=1392394 RepID=UPI0026153C09|nr:DoxX family protein [uncultured Litoreibacter sp.]
MTDGLAFAGRFLLAILLVLGAFQKLGDASGAMGLLANWGLPAFLVYPALVFNAVAGAALLAGWQTRPIALLAAAYCAVTSVFHYIPDDPWQMSIFVKNWSIAGGFLMLAAYGPGRYSIDAH